MATFRQRVYYYKLYLFTQVFASSRIKGKAKEILYYFLLRESGILDQVINANSSNANSGLKINKKQSSVQVGSNLVLCEDPAYLLTDASDYFRPGFYYVHRVPCGHTKEPPIDAENFIARLYNSNTIQ